MHTLFTLVSAGAIAALSILVAGAKDVEEDITLDKVPKAVLDAAKARFKGADLLGAAKKTDQGRIGVNSVSRSLAEAQRTAHGRTLHTQGRNTPIQGTNHHQRSTATTISQCTSTEKYAKTTTSYPLQKTTTARI